MTDLSTPSVSDRAAPDRAVSERVRFRLTGPSRAYDPVHQAIRPDLADIAEAEHHFAPHYAAPLLCTTTSNLTLYAAADAGSNVLGEVGDGARFYLLDVTGGWGWGYREDGHLVGYLDAALLEPGAQA